MLTMYHVYRQEYSLPFLFRSQLVIIKHLNDDNFKFNQLCIYEGNFVFLLSICLELFGASSGTVDVCVCVCVFVLCHRIFVCLFVLFI